MKKVLIFITVILIISFTLSVAAGTKQNKRTRQDNTDVRQAPVVVQVVNWVCDELGISPDIFPLLRNDGGDGDGASGDDLGNNRDEGPGDDPCTGPVCP